MLLPNLSASRCSNRAADKFWGRPKVRESSGTHVHGNECKSCGSFYGTEELEEIFELRGVA